MSVTVHQRPGVYSSYDASSVLSGSAGGRLVGLAALWCVSLLFREGTEGQGRSATA